MPSYSPVSASSGASYGSALGGGGGGVAPFTFGHCRKENNGVGDGTGLITGTYVPFFVVAFIPDASAISGLTYLGNGIFRNDSGVAITKNFFWSGYMVHSGGTFPPVANNVTFTIGRFDGVNYIPDLTHEVATITTRLAVGSNTGNSFFTRDHLNVAIAPDEQVRLMIKRNAGSRSHVAFTFSMVIL